MRRYIVMGIRVLGGRVLVERELVGGYIGGEVLRSDGGEEVTGVGVVVGIGGGVIGLELGDRIFWEPYSEEGIGGRLAVLDFDRVLGVVG